MIWDMKEQAVCFVCFGLQCEKSLNRFDKMKETHPQIYDYCMNKLQIKDVVNFINTKEDKNADITNKKEMV